MGPRLTAQLRLRGQTLAIEAGAGVTAIFGPSGAGKTSLLRAIAGLERPDSGRIALDDEVWFDAAARRDRPPRERRIGFVFEDGALFPAMRVRENVAFGRASAVVVERALALMEATALAERYPRALSAGERQRVALARALAPAPRLLLLDEPFSSLDGALKERLYLGLKRYLREHPTPCLLVTHDLNEACVMADRLLVLLDGRIVQGGTPAEVLDAPATAAIARLVGARNVFESPAAPDGTLVWGPHRLLPLRPDPAARGWCIRPEHVRLSPAPQDAPYSGTVEERLAGPGGMRVRVRVAGAGELEALLPFAAADAYAPGREIGLDLPAAALRTLF